MLKRVAVCCSVLQRIRGWSGYVRSDVASASTCCNMLHCVAEWSVCCSAVQCVAKCSWMARDMYSLMAQCVAVCCSVLQCAIVCGAMRCNVFRDGAGYK